MKVALLPFAILLAIASMLPVQAYAQSNEFPTVVHQPPSGTTSEVSRHTTASPHITHYTLPPDRDQKARAISKVRLRLLYVNLLLLLSVISTIVGPVLNTYSRYQEHQADQYGLEVTHGMISDSGQVAAQAFNVLGKVDLADPDPNPMQIMLFYNHPAIPDRIQYCLSYDPWGKGESGEFVK